MQLQEIPSLFLLSTLAAFFTGGKQAAVKNETKNEFVTQT